MEEYTADEFLTLVDAQREMRGGERSMRVSAEDF